MRATDLIFNFTSLLTTAQMRILKYVFLLLLLIFIGASVFVATQKGDYEIVKTKVVNSSRTIVFNYVNDYKNWESWMFWDESGMKFTYPIITSGKGGSFSWEGSLEDGFTKTLSVKENDSILQVMEVNGLKSDIQWAFKDTTGGTKVTWRIKGKLGFIPKISAFLKGGVQKVLGEKYEKSLAKLDKTIEHEINTYTIKVNGVVSVPGSFYLHQSIRSTVANMPKNIKIMMSTVVHFFKKNKIPMGGKPFILYKSYDNPKGIVEFSVGIPVRDEIFTAPGSDIMFGKFESFQAVKTTLNGDYSHLREAWSKSAEYISKNNHDKNSEMPTLEMYVKSNEEEKQPSKWITELYVPITPKITIISSPSVPVQNTSSAAPNVAVETEKLP